MSFAYPSSSWGLSVATSNPLTFIIQEDSWFYLPSLTLSDREILFCPNTSTSNNFTIVLNSTFGKVSFSSSLSYGIFGSDWLLLDGTDQYNQSSVRIYCSYAKCQSALSGISFLPNQDYNGYEASLSIFVEDDGGCTFFAGGKQSTYLPVYFEIISIDDAPYIVANFTLGSMLYTSKSNDPLFQSPIFYTVENVDLVFSNSTGFAVFDQDLSESQGSLYTLNLTVSHGTLTFKTLLENPSLRYFSPYLSGLHWEGVLPPASSLQFSAEAASLANELFNGFVYTPANYYCGNDTLEFAVNSQGSTISMHSIIVIACVDTPLKFSMPSNYSGFESQIIPITSIVLTSIDTITANVTFTASVVTGVLGVYSPSNAFVISNNYSSSILVTGGYSDIVSVLASGIFYAGPKYFNGWDLMTFSISYPSQVGAGTQIITNSDSKIPINIIPVNDAPILYFASQIGMAASNSYTSLVNSTAIRASLLMNFIQYNVSMNSARITLENIVSIYDQDVNEENALGYSVMRINMTCFHCIFSLNSLAGLAIISGSLADGSVIVEGGIDDLNFALSVIGYKPISNYWGMDTIFISVSDMGFTGSGDILDPSTLVPLYDSGTMLVNVSYVNAAPVVPYYSSVISTLEDTSVNLPPFNFTHLNHPPVASTGYLVNINVTQGILTSSNSNFPSISSSAVSLSDINVALLSNGSTGNILIRSSNTSAIFSMLSNLLYTPNLDFYGVDVLFFSVTDLSDGQSNNATIGIAVDAVNDAPILTFANSSYLSVPFVVVHDVSSVLPQIQLVDIDADYSNTPMTLSISALYGSLAFLPPESYTLWDSQSMYLNFSQSIQVTGSLSSIRLALQFVLYRSPSNETLRKHMGTLQSLSDTSIETSFASTLSSFYPAFTNDTISYIVTDNGATGSEIGSINPLTSAVSLSISITNDLKVPAIINNLPVTIQIPENGSYVISSKRVHIISTDLSTSNAAVLRALLHLSVDAVAAGVDLQFGIYCPSATKTNLVSLASGATISEPAAPAFMNDIVYSNRFNLLGSVTYTFESLTFSELNACLSNFTIVTSSPYFYGVLNDAISIYIERTDSPALPSVVRLSVEYSAINNSPAISSFSSFSLSQGTSSLLPSITVSDPDFSDVTFVHSLMNVTVAVSNGTITMFAAESIVVSYPVLNSASNTKSQLNSIPLIQFTGSLDQINHALSSIVYNAPIATGSNPCGFDTLHVEVNDLGTYGSGGALTASSDSIIYLNC